MTTPPRVTLIRLTLHAEAPVAVTSPESATDQPELPVARDATDAATIPASTLAGALRHLLGPHATRLMGADPTAETLHASRLWVLGTRVTAPIGAGEPDRPDTTWRWQTAIDRRRGAAGPTLLRRSETLSTGTTITAYLRFDTDPHTPDEHLLLSRLARWSPRLGRGISGGHGRLRITALDVGRLDLARTDDLTVWLTIGGTDLFDHVATQPYALSTPDTMPWLVLRWQLADALHISGRQPAGAPANQDDPDGEGNLLPLHRSDGTPTVAGTSWKGIFRSRAEFILRSLDVDPTPCGDGCCGECPTCRLFGHGGGSPTGNTVGQRAAIAFRDSRIDDAAVEHRPHVAIDRFTAGARDTALYTDEVVAAGTITLHIDTLGDTPSWARGLLLAVARDIHDGLVGVGHSTTRGYGTLHLPDPRPVRDQQARTEIAEALTTLRTKPSQPEPTHQEPQ